MSRTPITDNAYWHDRQMGMDIVEARVARELEEQIAVLKEKLRQTKKYLRAANRGAQRNAMVAELAILRSLNTSRVRDEHHAAEVHALRKELAILNLKAINEAARP